MDSVLEKKYKHAVEQPYLKELQHDESFAGRLKSRSMLWSITDESGKMVIDTSTMSPLLGKWPYGQKLMFRLDYESHAQLSDLTLSLRLADLKDGPIQIKHNGSEFNVIEYQILSDPSELDKLMADILIEGKLKSPVYRYQYWRLVKDNKLMTDNYVSYQTESSSQDHDTAKQTGYMPFRYKLSIYNFDPKWEQEELKLIAPIVDNRYFFDQEWTFPIEVPAAEPLKIELKREKLA